MVLRFHDYIKVYRYMWRWVHIFFQYEFAEWMNCVLGQGFFLLRYHVVFMEWRLYMREVVVVSRQDVPPTVQASCLCNLYIVETATGQHGGSGAT